MLSTPSYHILMKPLPSACLILSSKTKETKTSHTSIIHIPTGTRLHRLKQLIHLLITHLLTQISQNISQLANTNEARHVLVKHLEAAAVFFWLARVAEAAGAVEDFGERLEIDCSTISLDILEV
jgi:hypothetical protein